MPTSVQPAVASQTTRVSRYAWLVPAAVGGGVVGVRLARPGGVAAEGEVDRAREAGRRRPGHGVAGPGGGARDREAARAAAPPVPAPGGGGGEAGPGGG